MDAMFEAYEVIITMLLLEGRMYEDVRAYLTEQTGLSHGLSSRRLHQHGNTRRLGPLANSRMVLYARLSRKLATVMEGE